MIASIPTTTLLMKAGRHPLRAVRRLVETARLSRLTTPKEREVAGRFLSDVFHVDARAILENCQRSGIGAWMQRRRAQLAEFPGYRLGSTPTFDLETIYSLVRAMRPSVVVETGVCYGASSAYILEALRDNGHGVLYSIDLGNTPDEPPNDFFVRPSIKHRWRLIIGDSRRELPRLLARLGQIDLFHHDSLHTYEHMMWEYETAFPYLGPDGVLSSHDVRAIMSLSNPFQRNPFSAFCERHNLRSVEARNVGIATRWRGRQIGEG
jgi:predicted O-methyltransferase YrrM